MNYSENVKQNFEKWTALKPLFTDHTSANERVLQANEISEFITKPEKIIP